MPQEEHPDRVTLGRHGMERRVGQTRSREATGSEMDRVANGRCPIHPPLAEAFDGRVLSLSPSALSAERFGCAEAAAGSADMMDACVGGVRSRALDESESPPILPVL